MSPTANDNRQADENIAVADLFERQRLDALEWKNVDGDLARRMVAAAEEVDADTLSDDDVLEQLVDRGYLWLDMESSKHFATAAGISAGVRCADSHTCRRSRL